MKFSSFNGKSASPFPCFQITWISTPPTRVFGNPNTRGYVVFSCCTPLQGVNMHFY